MSGEAMLVFDDGLTEYDFGRGHPMSPIRVELTIRLASALGVLDELKVVPAPTADDALLETVHTAEYIAAVKHAGEDPDAADVVHGLGTRRHLLLPADARGLRAYRRRLGRGGRGRSGRATCCMPPTSPAGCITRCPSLASGFCVYNDPAIAIQWLLDHGAERVAYVDVDVHHGDGVQAAFYNDPRVLTVSLHESPTTLFPGTGAGRRAGRTPRARR